MSRQIRNITGYCLVMLLLFMALFFYRQAFLVVLFLLMILLPAVSIALCRYSFGKCRVGLMFSAPEAEKNLATTLAISFENPSHIPLLHMECPLSLNSVYYEKREPITYILPVAAGGNQSFSMPVSFQYCGLFEAKITTVKAYDYLHFVSFSKQVDAHAQIYILPDSRVEISCHPSFYVEGFDEYETSSQTGNASSNVTDVREYRPGDRLQKIHWKLSAKIDKLMVKENEAAALHQFYVLLELYQSIEHREFLDQAIEYSYGVTRELLDHREPIIFGFYSDIRGEFRSFPIRCEEDYIQAVKEAYYEQPYTTPDLGLGIYRDSGMQKGTLIQITHKGVSDEFLE